MIVIAVGKGTVSPAGLYYVSPGQANFLIPSGVAPEAASVFLAVPLDGSHWIAHRGGILRPLCYRANGNGAGVAAAVAERAIVHRLSPFSVLLPDGN